MAWNYLHFENLRVTEIREQAGVPKDPDETPLQAFLDMYGDSNWELIYVAHEGSRYELIFKQPK